MDQSASAATEMALMMPILFALMFTTYEGGHYMWTEHKVLKGVRDGARYAARLPFDYYSCSSAALQSPTGQPNAATRESEIRNLTRTGMISGGLSKVPGWTPKGQEPENIAITVACKAEWVSGTPASTGLYSKVVGGAPHVTVSTVVTYPSILGMLGFDTSAAKVRAQANAAVTGL